MEQEGPEAEEAEESNLQRFPLIESNLLECLASENRSP
jgi:hypothetical protein